MPKVIALIPARSGSKRIKDKNIKLLGRKPLISYTIDIAKKSKIFDHIYCVTDSKKYFKLIRNYPVDEFPIRPKSISGSKSPDYKWVEWAFKVLKKKKIDFEIYCILRPTSPFRTVSMLKRGLRILLSSKAHSVRAVEKTPTHPGKIWEKKGKFIKPILNKKIGITPWHSCQYASLPKYYSQNASLEFSWKDIFEKYKLISGKKIAPLITKGYEGFDINDENDFDLAKIIINKI